ncbi:MAG TPA: ribonuclease P protein component [Deltaproteobacteria bacterium]|nr:MAG: ribonuclease P protein component [Deltaproteobacteria bacterium]HDM77495.1 ribonuclease P protein component [Deltaproteobacteria bacterium]
MGEFSFRKNERLRKRKDFQTVKERGKRISTKNFILLIKPNSLPYNRLGVIVSKKTGNAVQRNRVKRCLREFFRLNKKDFAPPPKDIVIIAKKGANRLNTRAITEELLPVLTQPARY